MKLNDCANIDLSKIVDNDTYKFYTAYKHFSEQTLPKVGDHVFKVNSSGKRIGNSVYIVDMVIAPGIVVGRKLLSNGKSYGKFCCINNYASLKIDENQLLSTLIDQPHDYMKDQQEKNKEKRRISAKINRYNNKISIDTIVNRDSALDLIKSLEVGDNVYSSPAVRFLKQNMLTLIKKENNIYFFSITLKPWRSHFAFDLEKDKFYARFLTKEVPLDFEDFKTI